jgi:hypothetical protein
VVSINDNHQNTEKQIRNSASGQAIEALQQAERLLADL